MKRGQSRLPPSVTTRRAAWLGRFRASSTDFGGARLERREHPIALQLRYLQTLLEISGTNLELALGGDHLRPVGGKVVFLALVLRTN
ncbi:MAG TPA: hypothetical protein VFW14_20980 [Gaiellales bacterium]|nr:hypothetical protein [Gaiellales bacterium]